MTQTNLDSHPRGGSRHERCPVAATDVAMAMMVLEAAEITVVVAVAVFVGSWWSYCSIATASTHTSVDTWEKNR